MSNAAITIALNITKLLGALLAGAFGLLGLLTEFRNPNTKRITTWGRVALIGIIASTAIGAISQILEFSKSSADAAESTRQTQTQLGRLDTILNQMNRSLNPLSDVRISYWIRVSGDEPGFATYRKRLERGVSEIVSSPKNGLKAARVRSLGYIFEYVGDRPNGVVIPTSSPLMPTQSETLPYRLLHFHFFTLEFFKHPLSPTLFTAAKPQLPIPDLQLNVSTDSDQEGHGDHELEYDLPSHTLKEVAHRLFSDPQFWQSNGQIVSIPDLSGIQLVIRLPVLMELERVILHIKSRELWLDERKLAMRRILVRSQYPSALYVITLPKEIEKLEVH